jgi:hypothetical protein
MPLNYEPIQQLAYGYQVRPTKAAGIRLERGVREMLQLDEEESVNDYDWTIMGLELDWDDVLSFLLTNKSAHTRDLFIGALIDNLNERNLLPE